MKIKFGTVVNVRCNLYKLNKTTLSNLYSRYGRCISENQLYEINERNNYGIFGIPITIKDLELVSYNENPVVIISKNFIYGYRGHALKQWVLDNRNISITEALEPNTKLDIVGKDLESYSFRSNYFITGPASNIEVIDGFHKIKES